MLIPRAYVQVLDGPRGEPTGEVHLRPVDRRRTLCGIEMKHVPNYRSGGDWMADAPKVTCPVCQDRNEGRTR